MHWKSLQLRSITTSVCLMVHLVMIGLMTDLFSLLEAVAALYTLIIITILQDIDEAIQSPKTINTSINYNLTIAGNPPSLKHQPTLEIPDQKPPQEDNKQISESTKQHKEAQKCSIKLQPSLKIPDPKLPQEDNEQITESTKQFQEVQKEEHPNLYIERWKALHLNILPRFPLDRLAFLNSVISECDKRHYIFLRNSQLKQLSRKEGFRAEEHVVRYNSTDDHHPKKLITDLFAIYVHRRSHFYRGRKVWAAGRRQFTLNYLLKDNSELGATSDSLANLVFVAKGPYSCYDLETKSDSKDKKPDVDGLKGKLGRLKEKLRFSTKNSDANEKGNSDEDLI